MERGTIVIQKRKAIGLLLVVAVTVAAFAASPLTFLTSGLASHTAQAQAGETRFRVRIENTSNESALPTPLSPGVWAVHDEPAPFFTTGEPDRGDGLEAIAEDGNPDPLASSLAGQAGIASSGIFDTPVGASGRAPLLPGEAYEFEFSATPGDELSLATMLVQTNDIFAGPVPSGIALFDENGNPLPARDITAELPFWDAGTEVNEAPGMGPNQAPRQAAPDTGSAEGVVDFFTNTTRGLPLPSGIVDISVTEDEGEFTIVVENISGTRAITTPIAPVFYATHSRAWTFFEIDEPASDGLELLAEDGPPSGLVSEHVGATGTGEVGAATTPVGGSAGPAFPGQRYEFSVTPTLAYPYLSLASMVAESNDAFLAFDPEGIALLNARGVPRSVEAIAADIQRELAVWDAGTELNEVPGAGPNQPLRTAPATNVGEDENGNVRRYADATNDLAGSGLGGFAEVEVNYIEGTDPPQFEVIVRNTSGNTAYNGGLTPVAWAIHTNQFRLFEIGEPASEALQRLAEDGNVQPLLELFADSGEVAASGFQNTPDGTSDTRPIFDGEEYRFTVTVPDGANRYLSVASMVIPSNDTFLAFFPQAISLVNPTTLEPRSDIDQQIAQQLVAWDAGTERNQAGAAGPDQAPRQAGPDTGADEGPGTISILTPDNPEPVWEYPLLENVLRATLIPIVEADGPGVVFTATNDPAGNEVVMYNRGPDGRLTYVDRYATGGAGSGAGLTAPVDPLGSQNSLIVYEDWLFVVNAGSNEVSVFSISRDGLTLVDTVPSGGTYPVSLTVYNDWLYVLNAGGDGNITGFTIGNDGSLTPLANSTRSLETGNTNPPNTVLAPSQVAFSPDGDWLVITEGGSNEIHVFAVDESGLPGTTPVSNTSEGNVPFSLLFTDAGSLLVPEAADGAVSSYSVNTDGTLQVLSSNVPNNQAASCWIVGIGEYAYVSNTASNSVSSYTINPDGSIILLEEQAFTTAPGSAPTDMAVSGNYIYVLNPGLGTVTSYVVDPSDGSVESLRNAVNILSDFPGPQGVAAYDFAPGEGPGQTLYLPIILR